ncbi:MAG: glycoside hydrolase family 16 protein [Kineosporiaceae bacterium]
MPGNLPGWKVTASDDFTAAALDLTNWGVYDGVPGGNEPARWSKNHVAVQGGKLVLQNYMENGTWVSGGVSRARGGGQTYGRYDIRFRVDKADHIGYAILLYPSSGKWPPEIDIAEDGGGNRAQTSSTLHYGSEDFQIQVRKQADFSQWHTVSVIWKQNRLEYYLDGARYGVTNSAMVPSEPMWLGMQTQYKRCNEWDNCNYGSMPTQANMEIDWVVRYAYDPTTAPTPTTTTTSAAPSTSTTSNPPTTTSTGVSPLDSESTSPSPTTSTPSPTPTDTGPEPGTPTANGPNLVVSASASRVNSVALQGTQLTGQVYVQALPKSPVEEVTFYLDDPNMQTHLVGAELYTPYDLAGGDQLEAKPWNVSDLTPGVHTLYVRTIDSEGNMEVSRASFTAGSVSSIPPRVATVQRLTELRLSSSPTRTPYSPLAGATVGNTAYVTAVPNNTVNAVYFWLDDTAMRGNPLWVERVGPYDLMGGSVTNAAPVDWSALSSGTHTLTTRTIWPDGIGTVTSATFTKSSSVTATAPRQLKLQVSSDADRAPSTTLNGAKLGDTVYVTAVPTAPATAVHFWLDDTTMKSKPYAVENDAPFDIKGGTVKAAAAWKLGSLKVGTHTLTARVLWQDGSTSATTATFARSATAAGASVLASSPRGAAPAARAEDVVVYRPISPVRPR